MTDNSNSSDESFLTGVNDISYDSEELVYSLKQGLSISDVQNQGSVFDLDLEKDLADLACPSGNEYFDKDSVFDQLTYPDDSESEPDEGEKEDEREPFDKIVLKMKPLTPDKGVMKRMRNPGFGGVPGEKSQVTIHYNSYLQFLDEPIDSTRLRNRPLRFILNDGSVIPGLNLAVGSMRQNEVAEFVIRSDYGLGKMGCPPRIPPDATILYVVELLSIVDCSASIEFEQMNAEERKMASFTKVMEVCKAENRAANELYKNKQYPRSMKLYNKAVRMLSGVNMANVEEEKQQQSLLAKLYCNLSQCFLSMNSPDRAIPCAISALKIDPLNSKALFRCGKACRLNGEFHKAKQYLRRVAKKEPSNQEVLREIQELNRDIAKYEKLEKQFCSNIFKNTKMSSPPSDSTSGNKNLVVSDEFKASLEKYLTDFKTGDFEFIPFTSGFSDSDIESVKKIATDMGLHYVVPQHGEAKLRIYKNKPQE